MKKICLVFVWMICVGMASSVFAQIPGRPYQGSGTAEGSAGTGGEPAGPKLQMQQRACNRATKKAHSIINTAANLSQHGHYLSGNSVGGCQCDGQETAANSNRWGWVCYVQYTYQLQPL